MRSKFALLAFAGFAALTTFSASASSGQGTESGTIRRGARPLISLPVYGQAKKSTHTAPVNPVAQVSVEKEVTEEPQAQPIVKWVIDNPLQIPQQDQAADFQPGGFQTDQQAQISESLGSDKRPLMRPLQQVVIDLNHHEKRVPGDRSPELFKTFHNDWQSLVGTMPLDYQWEAPNIRYRKLYFEDVAAERYGQIPCGWRGEYRVTCHWAASLLSAPLKMRLDPYFDCDTPYGFCRPGERTPTIWQSHVYR